jgi:hypothetical protein
MFAFTAAVGVVSCTLLTGVGDLSVATDAGSDGTSPIPTTTGHVDAGSPPNDADVDPDSSFLGEVDASTVDGCSPTGCYDIPLGFQLVSLGPTTQPCPTDFAVPQTVVSGPTVGGGACSCGCSITTHSSCQVSTLTQHIGNNPDASTCPNQFVTNLNAGCGMDGYLGPFNNWREFWPNQNAAGGGLCNSQTNKDGSKLSSQSQKLCQATVVPRCDTKICPPKLPAPYAACIATAGDVDCPTDFPKKTLGGSKADFSCDGTCGCSGVSGDCNTGTISFYFPPDCSGTAGVSYPVNGTCVSNAAASGNPNAPYGSHKYFPDPVQNEKCNLTGSVSPSAPSLSQVTTVCCN